MGYRLYIIHNVTEDEICLGKLFGYVEYDTRLRAFKFLELIGKVHMPEDEFAFAAGASMDINLSKTETQLFTDLYTLDYQEVYETDCKPFFDEDLKRFMENHSGNFILEWS